MSNIKKFDQQVWINDKLSIGDDYFNLPRVAIDMSGKTDAIAVPKGSTLMRPTTATTAEHGYFRYNDTLNQFEGFQNLEWQQFVTNVDLEVSPDKSIQFASGTTQTGVTTFLYDYEKKTFINGTNNTYTNTNSIIIGNNSIISGINNFSFGTGLSLKSDYSLIGGGVTITDENSDYSFHFQYGDKGSHIYYSNYATIIGGDNNNIDYSIDGFIGGGSYNKLYGDKNNNSNYSGIIAGTNNSILGDSTDISQYSFIGSGSGNTINHASKSAIIAGSNNIINGPGKFGGFGVIVGGANNELNGRYNIINAGRYNVIDSGSSYSSIIGGYNNKLSSIDYSSVIGGRFNTNTHTRSVILGGANITSIQDDLVHVPDLFIDNLSGNSANIIINAAGVLVTGTSSGMVQYLDDLLDVIAPSGSSNDGDYLIFDSSQNQWVASGITGDELSAGTGISIDDSVSGYVIISTTDDVGRFNISGDTGSGYVYGNDTITFTGDNIISTSYLDTNSAITISADMSDYYTTAQTNANYLSASTSVVGGSISNTQIAFGNSSNQITGSSELTWDGTNLQVSGSSSESVVISSSGSYYLGNPTTSGSWRFKINSSGDLVIEKYNGSSWQVGQTISV